MIPCLIDFARPVPVLGPGTDLAKAMHEFRTGGLTALPVVDEGRVIGHLTEHDAVLALGSSVVPAIGAIAPPAARIVSAAMRTDPDLCAAPSESIATAWEKMRSEDLPFLAVTDPGGILIGVATRAELLAGLQGDLRPATIGGLATPLGVYLTTLHHRAGAGDLGLFLTGVMLMTLDLAAVHGTNWLAGYFPLLASNNPATSGLSDLGLLAALLGFFALLRLTPLTGTHAAEHQVVHAIEKGEPLTAESVTAQPKEHPRCGTNLAAAALAAQVALPRLVESPALASAAVLALFFTWRKLGWGLQRLFTTKKALPRQVDGAIGAGRELLARHSCRPVYQAPRWRCVWNTGAVQILLGAAVVLLASELVL